MGRVPAFSEALSKIITGRETYTAIVSSQVISNVPSAILLSRFTGNYKELLLGVNIGGTGTLISSLASLITFSHFRTLRPGHTKKYIGLFTLMNIIFLVVMTLSAWFFFR